MQHETSAQSDAPLTADLATLVREPQQARSRKTLDRLVEAAHTLLSREGPDGLTVTGIAKRAGASVGSFYARFDGKEELIRYVGEAALAEALQDWFQALESALSGAGAGAGGDGDAGADGSPVPGISRHLLDAFRSGPARRLRALDGLEDPSPSRLQRFESRVGGDLERVFTEQEGAPGQRARVAALVTLAALQAAAEHQELASPAEEIAVLVSLYLGTAAAPVRRTESESEGPAPDAEDAEDDAPPADDDPVDPFDVWG